MLHFPTEEYLPDPSLGRLSAGERQMQVQAPFLYVYFLAKTRDSPRTPMLSYMDEGLVSDI
jgi:hypothetical protein